MTEPTPVSWNTAIHCIGIKELEAIPMTRGEYNLVRGWTIPENEDPDDGGYIVRYQDGYISWSPEMQFDMAYCSTNHMDFGSAIHFLKDGCKVARDGWNGNAMWIILQPGSKEPIEMTPGSRYAKAGLDFVKIDSHIDMMTAQGTMQPGWIASQADMLAHDWSLVE